ncbi:MAG: transporter substrate-binding domain-containing protein [Spirochaetaceae bacterium]|jgi:L-cystine transport system substrate-binding protein|nr:transporter substrate-binding domain-containing protein [Spirochaetaceae bacterium]
MKKFRIFSVFAVAFVLVALMLANCKGKNTVGTAGGEVPRKIVVGTGNVFKGFCFIDEKGELAGYEIDVLKAVDEMLPQYEFELETAEFRAILVGLEAKKYDFAAHNYAKNTEREAKFLYGKVPNGFYSYSLVVRKDETGISSVSDLEGRNVSTNTGSNVSGLLEAYNKEQATRPINLIYGSLEDEGQIKGITEGRFDAYIIDEKRFLDQNRAFPGVVKETGPRLLPGYTYYIYNKGDERLQQDIDAALTKLRENGTLSTLSKKWFIDDYSGLLPELEELRAQGKA